MGPVPLETARRAPLQADPTLQYLLQGRKIGTLAAPKSWEAEFMFAKWGSFSQETVKDYSTGR